MPVIYTFDYLSTLEERSPFLPNYLFFGTGSAISFSLPGLSSMHLHRHISPVSQSMRSSFRDEKVDSLSFSDGDNDDDKSFSVSDEHDSSCDSLSTDSKSGNNDVSEEENERSIWNSENTERERADGLAQNKHLWPADKQYLMVRFQNGTTSEKNLVKDLVEKHYHAIPMRIRFKFLEMETVGHSDIRLEFTTWSGCYIGRSAEKRPRETTMWLNLKPKMKSHEERQTQRQASILHEFGHALGMVHEHTHPDCKANWNYRVLQAKSGWDAQRVHDNYNQRHPSRRLKSAPYDPKSIMHYPIEQGDTHNVVDHIPKNCELSSGDQEFLTALYPIKSILKTRSEFGTGDEKMLKTLKRCKEKVQQAMKAKSKFGSIDEEALKTLQEYEKQKHEKIEHILKATTKFRSTDKEVLETVKQHVKFVQVSKAKSEFKTATDSRKEQFRSCETKTDKRHDTELLQQLDRELIEVKQERKKLKQKKKTLVQSLDREWNCFNDQRFQNHSNVVVDGNHYVENGNDRVIMSSNGTILEGGDHGIVKGRDSMFILSGSHDIIIGSDSMAVHNGIHHVVVSGDGMGIQSGGFGITLGSNGLVIQNGRYEIAMDSNGRVIQSRSDRTPV